MDLDEMVPDSFDDIRETIHLNQCNKKYIVIHEL
jgi:hypothetical protein